MSDAEVTFPAPAAEPPLELLYCDERLAVVNKPSRLMVHDSKLARGEDDFLADVRGSQLSGFVRTDHGIPFQKGCIDGAAQRVPTLP